MNNRPGFVDEGIMELFKKPLGSLMNNERVEMTRRYPRLPNKILRRDSDVAKRIITAWDKEKNSEKVLDIFLKEKKNLSDERYWELLRTVWIVSGGVDNLETFRYLMQSTRRERYYFSTPEEAKKLREMPEQLEVFRAGYDSDNGISWTLDKDYAEYYAATFNKPKVFTKIINKKEVFAYIERNMEFEIILL